MKRFWFSILLVLASTWAFAGVEVCPALPQNSGLRWAYREGPDFDVCYANVAGTQSTAIGIYFGHAPNFTPNPAALIGPGTFAGVPVTWYRKRSSTASPEFSREAVLTGTHVWVLANSEQELKERLAIAERMSFK
jgi:hypothetical protein